MVKSLVRYLTLYLVLPRARAQLKTLFASGTLPGSNAKATSRLNIAAFTQKNANGQAVFDVFVHYCLCGF